MTWFDSYLHNIPPRRIVNPQINESTLLSRQCNLNSQPSINTTATHFSQKIFLYFFVSPLPKKVTFPPNRKSKHAQATSNEPRHIPRLYITLRKFARARMSAVAAAPPQKFTSRNIQIRRARIFRPIVKRDYLSLFCSRDDASVQTRARILDSYTVLRAYFATKRSGREPLAKMYIYRRYVRVPRR